MCREHVDRLDGLIRLHPRYADLESEGCEVEPEKTFIGKHSEEGDECRLMARQRYLSDILGCLAFSPNLRLCCEGAYTEYCRAWEACPA